jgi:hypothetical protein
MSLKRRVDALDGGEDDPNYLPQDDAIHLLHALDQPDPMAALRSSPRPDLAGLLEAYLAAHPQAAGRQR